jgi:cytochrome c biogenesis protein CcdA
MALRLPDWIHRRIHGAIRAGSRLRYVALAAAGTGVVVSFLEFGCTGQVYLPTIVSVARRAGEDRALAVLYLLGYNVMFILPLVAVFLLAFFGTSSRRLTEVFRRHLAAIKFATAVLFVTLGGLVIYQFLS